MLSKEAVEEFQKIYEWKEGQKLSDKEASEMATNLLLVFKAIYRPIPWKNKNELKRYVLQHKSLKSKS